MTSNKKRIRLSEIIGPAFYETHKLIDMGVIDEAVEAGGRASLKSSYVGTELVLQLLKHPDCHALVTRQVGDTIPDRFSQSFYCFSASKKCCCHWK